jgi:MFS family permease
MSDLTEYFTSLRGNLLVIVSSLIIWKFVLQMVSPYESIYVFAIGGSGVTIGILSTTRMLVSTFLRIPGGYLADKRSRRQVIGFAIIVSSLGYLFFIFAKNWTWLLPGVILLSITGLAEPATEAIKADSVKPEERGRGYAIISTLPDIPALVAPVIGGYLIVERGSSPGISLTGIRFVYICLLVGVVTAGLIRLLFLKDVHQHVQEEGIKLGLNMFRDAYEVVSESPSSVKRLLVLGGFFMFCFHLDSSIRAVYAINVGGLSTVQWGWIVSITSVISSLGALMIGKFIDSYGRKRVFIPAVTILGISSLLFAFSESYQMFLFARILGGIGLYGRMISFQVLIADSIPGRVRGRIMGVYNIFSSMGSSTAVLISGILYDLSPKFPFYVSIFAYGFAALIATKLLNEPEIKQI